ncbi:methylmalonyl-CoA mutase subunit beta [Psychroflexus aestuariivivens]|uniref:methylmalonyl-CoA mutase subunit beta n=1 Tax=Psychroflexus aestuariivivens TaxID=1795040 RepID=UPI000FDC6471|nr:methylmalonyl-CoA mutase subunit beta [Psychroflexus aestuariivivens]
MTKKLFEEFESVSAKAWKQKIQVDLKGADYNDTLVTKTDEGIDIKPFYHRDEQDENFKLPQTQHWLVTEKIYLENTDISIENAKDVINRGAESLWIIIPEADTKKLSFFEAFDQNSTQFYVEFLFFDIDFMKNFHETISKQNLNLRFGIDPINHLASDGNWFNSQSQDFEDLLKINENSKLINNINVDARIYQNSGANISQQLAYSLAHLNEYFNLFNNKEYKVLNVNLVISVGAHYFMEIAKIKALKLLVESLASEYNFKVELNILAEPSSRNHTIYDYNMNMLRTTTACMSAILGGADWVNNLAYDEIFHKRNEFGERISRNQLLILKQESYFDKVKNPVDGTYYIESLTKELAEQALSVFKNIEAGGGFIQQLFEGKIQKKIKESADKEMKKIQSGKSTLVGTNKYVNPEDKMRNDLELYPFLKQNKRKTLVQPIIPRRLAEEIEQTRLDEEQKASSTENR